MDTFKQTIWPLRLIIVATIFCAISLSAVPACSASNQGLEVTSSNEVTFIPSDQLSGPSFDSDLSVSYQTPLFSFESETEFNLEGYDEGSSEFGFTFDHLEWSIDLEFDGENVLDTWGSAVALELSPELEIEADYETELLYEESDEKPDRELEIALDQELSRDVSVELSSEFTNQGGSFSFPPENSEMELNNLGSGDFLLDSSLELYEMKPMEVDFEVSRSRPVTSDPYLDFQVDLTWGIMDDFLQFDPELEAEFGTVSFENKIDLTSGNFLGSLKVQEVEVSDLTFGSWEIDISNDFESGETEINLQTGEGPTEFNLGCNYQPSKTNSLIGLDRLTGEFIWEPSENSEITIEVESDTDTFPSEITLSSEHTF